MTSKSNAFIVIAISFSIFGCQNPAVSNPVEKVSPEIASIASAWGMCRAKKRLELLNSNLSAEDVSEAELVACTEFENRLQKALEPEYGLVGAANTVRDLRARSRNGGIASVSEIRGGPAVEDPTSSWGKCIGTKMDELSLPNSSSNSVADAALDACKEYESAVHKATAKKYGVAQADSNRDMMRAEMRRRAIEMLESEQ